MKTKVLFRFFTEDVNRERLCEVLSKHVSGFTILPGQGYWRGESKVYSESSLCIEVLGEQSERNGMRQLAEHIRAANEQEAVLLQELPIAAEFISAVPALVAA